MGCPFKNLLPTKRVADTSAQVEEDEGISKCPFSSLLRAQSSEGRGSLAAADASGKGAAQEASQPSGQAVCPYGFSSSAGPKLSPLHCILCKALLHEPVRVQKCEHLFCGYCIKPFKDCPACGADVVGLRKDTATQVLIDTFLEAHGGLATFEADDEQVEQTSCGKSETSDTTRLQGDGSSVASVDASSATFFLQLAIQSSAGGNLPAAMDRLDTCRTILLRNCQQITSLADNGSTLSAPSAIAELRHLASRLGAVYGSQGDCCRKMGHMNKALGYYQQSLECLHPHVDDDVEVAHSLSVTMNKMGDVRYMCDDIAGALTCYKEALELRKKLLEIKQGGVALETKVDSHAAAEVLDVVSSLIKVADASSVLGTQSEATELFHDAKRILEQLQKTCGWSSESDPSDLDRLQARSFSLMNVVNQQLACAPESA